MMPSEHVGCLTTMGEQPKSLDYSVIGEPLNNLLKAVGNKLTREWPSKYADVAGGSALFVVHIRVARLTYLSALYLGGDKPPDPFRLPEFCSTLPLLNRSLLDSLLTIMFILEDVPQRVALFYEADWRELRLGLDRLNQEYSHLPEFQSFLNDLTEHCNAGVALLGLTPQQAAQPTKLRSWPNPGALPNHGISPNSPLPANRAFMKFLNDYFYIDLSQQAHLGAFGMAKRGAFVLDAIHSSTNIALLLKKYRYAQMGQTVALVLALASEIEAHFGFGLKEQAKYVWGVASPNIFVVEELYRKRYQNLLA
jgi:hypothetical protein